MNIGEGASYEPEDVEEALKDFLERELGLHDARREEMQRVHRSGKSKNGKPWPILARFLRYKDVKKIFSLRHRLRETYFQCSARDNGDGADGRRSACQILFRFLGTAQFLVFLSLFKRSILVAYCCKHRNL